jgi:hypothetical protein
VTFPENVPLVGCPPGPEHSGSTVDAITHRGNRKNMSMLRKSAVTVAIAGAGLASMSGAAFATTSHHGDSHSQHHGSCTNTVKQVNKAEGGAPIDVAGGDNGAIPINICDVANGNHLLNGITVAIGDAGFTLPGGGELPGFPDFGAPGELPTF